MTSPKVVNLLNEALKRHQAGRPDQAAPLYSQVLALEPDQPDALYLLGLIALNNSQPDIAARLIGKSVTLQPANASAWNGLGSALWTLGRIDEAEAAYRDAFRLNSNDTETANNLANLLLARGQWGPALDMIGHSLTVQETPRAKRMFVALVGQLDWARDNKDIRLPIIRALSEPWDRPGKLAQTSAALIKRSSEIGPAVTRANAAWPQRLSAEALLGPDGFAPLAADALLITLLTCAPNADMELERFLTMARGVMAAAKGDAGLIFRSALAQQCFINEYVFLPTGDETRRADRLRDEIVAALSAGNPAAPDMLVEVACYFPLHTLTGAETLLERAWPASVENVLTQQLREPLEEKRLAAAIARLTPINDAVSVKVQSQYEQNPYPRWVRTAPRQQRNLLDFLGERFPLSRFQRHPGQEIKTVLVAGCGTGQDVIASNMQPGGQGVLAVDLSLASLGYAKRKSQEADLAIEFGQGDILELRSLGRTFDMIQSLGVLHHMDDPLQAWKTLVDLLNPGGVMWLGFYSEAARRNIVQARGLIAERGVGTAPQDIRQFRQELYDKGDMALFASILKSEDFFSVSACRDLMFHVQEHRMTLPQIAAFLQDNNLTFLGFDLDVAVTDAYRRRFPEDQAATDLDNWAIWESEHPGMFAAMYVFWAQKA